MASPPRSIRRSLFALVMPLVLPAVVFGAVLATARPLFRDAPPIEPRRAYCTWACHNHGCPHPPRLPATLTADDGLYGATIAALFRAGAVISSDRRTGYGAANLLAFCIVWPGAMYALVVIALGQRRRIVSLRARNGTR